jgi:hypothetical protein
MLEGAIVLYGNATSEDIEFMQEDKNSFSFPSEASSTSSSTLSDAQSAAPDLDLLFNQICEE